MQFAHFSSDSPCLDTAVPEDFSFSGISVKANIVHLFVPSPRESAMQPQQHTNINANYS